MPDVVRLSTDAPWTMRACAEFMGFTPEWIRRAVVAGVTVRGGRCVKLEAETITVGTRCTYRIHVDRFCAFLEALGWQRLPALSFPSSNN